MYLDFYKGSQEFETSNNIFLIIVSCWHKNENVLVNVYHRELSLQKKNIKS